MTPAAVPFLDLHPAEDAADVRAAIERVVASGWYVLGPEVDAFEREFAQACGAAYAVGVGNGTDALALTLRALGIGPGDEVIVPSLTAAYTGLAVLMAGARPVIADIDPVRLTLDAAACAAAVTSKTAALIPVHLYGQAADLAALRAVADRHNLAVIEDCAQAHLATCGGAPAGTIGVAGAFSFYPTKNLGALGDGGAVITNDATLAQRLRRLRNGGQTDRYHHEDAGTNSRLDEMQAAILRARLPRLAQWTSERRAHARAYRQRLSTAPVDVPLELDEGHVYHLFPVRSEHRDQLQTHLLHSGIETLIHYPVALTGQPVFGAVRPGRCPEAERAARELLSLPLHPRLRPDDLQRVATAICEFQRPR